MNKQKQPWTNMAERLWKEQAKEQLAELREAMTGQPESSLAEAVERLEIRLEEQLASMTSSEAWSEDTRATSAQISEQLSIAKDRQCYMCGQPITDSPDCEVCAAVRESIRTMQISLEEKRKRPNNQT